MVLARASVVGDVRDGLQLEPQLQLEAPEHPQSPAIVIVL